ncbi:transcriptional regulator GcvA [Limibaculum sp. FT325]|nr:transcriptional regulator GcvA [Limibaculum sediminis]
MRAFEAAGRHLSFKKAAEELHVTPAAISQQVKALEEYCGVELFRRLTRALQLTEAGRAALPLLREGFDRLADGARALQAGRRGAILTVSVAPSFGAKWLVPRLDRFRESYPQYDVRIDATDRLADFSGDDVDVALRYGRGNYPGLRAECLLTDVVYPVCSPKLVKGDRPLRRPEDLRHHTLLHVDWQMEEEAAPNWRMWLRAAGVEGLDASRGPRFSADSMAVEAAAEGHGVALASEALAEGDLKTGRLVRPFPPSIRQATMFCYYLVYPGVRAGDAKVTCFRDWILAEIGGSDAQPRDPSGQS